MSINTQPAGADVFNGPERLGVTPCNVVMPDVGEPVELVMKKKGYKDQPLKIVPDKDHDFVSDLTPLAHAAPVIAEAAEVDRSRRRRHRSTAAGRHAETPKPAGKLRDLKDPFANLNG